MPQGHNGVMVKDLPGQPQPGDNGAMVKDLPGQHQPGDPKSQWCHGEISARPDLVTDTIAGATVSGRRIQGRVAQGFSLLNYFLFVSSNRPIFKQLFRSFYSSIIKHIKTCNFFPSQGFLCL